MADLIRVVPAPGLIVLGQDGTRLPDDGAVVPLDSFWRRRLRDGDVTRAPAAPNNDHVSE